MFFAPGPFPGLPGLAVGPKEPKIGQKPGAGFIILSSLRSAQLRFQVHRKGASAMDVTKPYEFIGFGAMDVTNTYEFIEFADRKTVKN